MTTSTKPIHEERIEEPAKAWRNWYVAIKGVTFDDGDFWKAGEIRRSDVTWPSREIAEQKAEEDAVDETGAVVLGVLEYLGAFPEGQRP